MVINASIGVRRDDIYKVVEKLREVI
ncbi:hypothetical protein [Methanocaldococcus infernus]